MIICALSVRPIKIHWIQIETSNKKWSFHISPFSSIFNTRSHMYTASLSTHWVLGLTHNEQNLVILMIKMQIYLQNRHIWLFIHQMTSRVYNNKMTLTTQLHPEYSVATHLTSIWVACITNGKDIIHYGNRKCTHELIKKISHCSFTQNRLLCLYSFILSTRLVLSYTVSMDGHVSLIIIISI